MREVLKASFALEEHAAEAGTFRGIASVFDQVIDSYVPTVIHKGAFRKTLRENKSRVRILWQHDDSEPIGLPTSMKETDLGLEVEGRISDTQRGRDAMTLIRDGVVTDLSIGFDPIKYDFEEPKSPGALRLRHVRELRLWEFSPVTWGANEPAKIQEVNALQAPVDVILERFAEHVDQVEINEAIRLLCGPIVTRQRSGELTADMQGMVRRALETLNGLLVTAEPEATPAPLTAQRQSRRLAELAMAEAMFAPHAHALPGGAVDDGGAASPHQGVA